LQVKRRVQKVNTHAVVLQDLTEEQNVDIHDKLRDLALSTKLNTVADVGVEWSIKYGSALVELRLVSNFLFNILHGQPTLLLVMSKFLNGKKCSFSSGK
jgi:uncharacterized membrane protein